MKKIVLIFVFCGLFVAASAEAYRGQLGIPLQRPRGHKLRAWFKRDLLPYDQRYLVVSALREIRSYLARAEALGLSSSQQAALSGLKESLEKDMERTMAELQRLSASLQEELRNEVPDQGEVMKLYQEIDTCWERITKKALLCLFKARKLLKPAPATQGRFD